VVLLILARSLDHFVTFVCGLVQRLRKAPANPRNTPRDPRLALAVAFHHFWPVRIRPTSVPRYVDSVPQ
jgi:hypothetical protein